MCFICDAVAEDIILHHILEDTVILDMDTVVDMDMVDMDMAVYIMITLTFRINHIKSPHLLQAQRKKV